jgi:hypothetical protein
VVALQVRVEVEPDGELDGLARGAVGAMTITRPVGGSAAAKASRSGGR